MHCGSSLRVESAGHVFDYQYVSASLPLHFQQTSVCPRFFRCQSDDPGDHDNVEIPNIHEEVLEMADLCAEKACTLVRAIVKKLPDAQIA